MGGWVDGWMGDRVGKFLKHMNFWRGSSSSSKDDELLEGQFLIF
jgi:hypothetical protein